MHCKCQDFLGNIDFIFAFVFPHSDYYFFLKLDYKIQLKINNIFHIALAVEY